MSDIICFIAIKTQIKNLLKQLKYNNDKRTVNYR